jgi:GTPase SAR1 family protein
VGGQDKIRSLWGHYYKGVTAVIFVIDSADAARMDECKTELEALLEEEALQDASFLIFANKQDIKNAFTPLELIQLFGLSKVENSLIQGRRWYVQGAIAASGEGIYEGLELLNPDFQMKLFKEEETQQEVEKKKIPIKMTPIKDNQ